MRLLGERSSEGRRSGGKRGEQAEGGAVPYPLLERLSRGGEAMFEAFCPAAPEYPATLPGEKGCPSSDAAAATASLAEPPAAPPGGGRNALPPLRPFAVRKGWWWRVGEAAKEFKERGYTCLVLPPLGKAAGDSRTARGYAVHDFYDFGGLVQKGSDDVCTRWGCEGELRAALTQLKDAGVSAITDVPITVTVRGTPCSRKFKRDASCVHPCHTSKDGTVSRFANGSALSLEPESKHSLQQLRTWAYHIVKEFRLSGVRWCSTSTVPAEVPQRFADPLSPEEKLGLELQLVWPSPGEEIHMEEWSSRRKRVLVMDEPLWKVMMRTVLSDDPKAGSMSELVAAGLCRSASPAAGNAVLFVSCVGVEAEMKRVGVTPDARMRGYAFIVGAGWGIPLVACADHGEHGLGPRIDRALKVCRLFATSGSEAEVVYSSDDVVVLFRPPGRVCPSVGVHDAPGCLFAITRGGKASADARFVVSLPIRGELRDVSDPSVPLPVVASRCETERMCSVTVKASVGYAILVPVE